VRSLVADLQELAKQHRLAVGGNGATAAGSAGLDAILLPEDPVAAAEQVTALAGADVARA
jgi:hypothetical protein